MMITKKDRDFLDLIKKSKKYKKLGSLKRHPGFPILVEKTNFLPASVSVLQRLWHIHNNFYQIPICKICNKNTVSWRKEKGGWYSNSCSNKCATSDPNRMKKIEKTNLKKYNSKNPFGNKEIQKKSKKTLKDNYNVDHPSQSKIIIQKRIKTWNTKYGVDHPSKNKNIIKKRQQTNLKRYNNINVLASEYGKNKIKKYCESNNINHPKQINFPKETLLKLNHKEWLYKQHIEKQKSLRLISKELEINESTVGVYLHNHGLKTQTIFQSIGEIEIGNFLEQNGIVIIRNTRSVISPYELDIFLPDYNIAIEYCGLFWHSEQCGKDKNYHLNKLKLCKNNNITLLTIFEDEWIFKKEIVKNILLYKLKKIDNRIYARKCNIIPVSPLEKKIFLENIHIQGNGPGSIIYGLEYNKNLVAVISFIKNNNDTFILNRYASKNVIGGFSKLLTYFEKIHAKKQIITFTDLRWGNGDMYIKNGFIINKILPPDYFYSPHGHKRYHKFNYRRKYLPKLLKFYDPLLSEKQNCDNNKILRIWDCGKIKFTKN